MVGLSKALAIRGRWPVPEDLASMVSPPFARVWGSGLTTVASFVRGEATGWESFAGVLEDQLAVMAHWIHD